MPPVFKWTLRYYATRKGNEWREVLGKIAGPLEAMRQAFGKEIEQDVVYLLGMAPTPIERGGERFGTTYEIVDLGRNKEQAAAGMAKLQEQARAEVRLQKLLSRDVYKELHEWLQGQVDEAEKKLEKLGEEFERKGSFEQWLSHGVDYFMAFETDGKIARSILERVKNDEAAQEKAEARAKQIADAKAAGLPTPPLPERPYRPRRRRWEKKQEKEKPLSPNDDRPFIHRRLAERVRELETMLMEGRVTTNHYHDEVGWQRAYDIASFKASANFLKTLKEKLAELDDRRAGIVEMERRAALRRKPVDELLGLEPPKSNNQQGA